MLSGVENKETLRNFVSDLINGKIKTLEFYLAFTMEASRDIKKTSKYESLREEIQEEIYHLNKQMHSLKTMQQTMKKVISSPTSIIQLGSLIITNKARFYISVSLGEFFFENQRFYAISPESPMAKAMWGKSVDGEFELNKIHQKIEQIL